MCKPSVIVPLLLFAVASYGCATPAPAPQQPCQCACPQLPPAPPQASQPPRKADFLERGMKLLFDSSAKPTP